MIIRNSLRYLFHSLTRSLAGLRASAVAAARRLPGQIANGARQLPGKIANGARAVRNNPAAAKKMAVNAAVSTGFGVAGSSATYGVAYALGAYDTTEAQAMAKLYEGLVANMTNTIEEVRKEMLEEAYGIQHFEARLTEVLMAEKDAFIADLTAHMEDEGYAGSEAGDADAHPDIDGPVSEQPEHHHRLGRSGRLLDQTSTTSRPPSPMEVDEPEEAENATTADPNQQLFHSHPVALTSGGHRSAGVPTAVSPWLAALAAVCLSRLLAA